MSRERKANLAALKAIYPSLPDEALQTLCEFAKFLAAKYPASEQVKQAKQPIARPQEESVIAAI